ncbi:hypothetical protein PAFU01_10890 [Pantoea ananatis]|nr:hypothetical protein PAFU01_10890 [Pantoea ananatis]
MLNTQNVLQRACQHWQKKKRQRNSLKKQDLNNSVKKRGGIYVYNITKHHNQNFKKKELLVEPIHFEMRDVNELTAEAG